MRKKLSKGINFIIALGLVFTMSVGMISPLYVSAAPDATSKVALEAALRNGTGLYPDDYVQETWWAWAGKVTAGEKALVDLYISQEEVDDLVKALKETLEGLVLRATAEDVNTLHDTITVFENDYLSASASYTTDSWKVAFEAYGVGWNLRELTPATRVKEEVIKATEALEKAIAGLAKHAVAGDYTRLRTAITDAKKFKEANFTEASWSVLVNAIAAGEVVLTTNTAAERINVSKAKVDEATAALRAAIDKLEVDKEVNKDALEAALKVRDDLTQADYTSDSWGTFDYLYWQAYGLVSDEYVTQAEVDAATEALEEAIKGLVELAKEEDFDALKAVIEAGKWLVGSDHTEVSWEVYIEALDAGKGIVERPWGLTKKEVTDATKAIEETQEGLVEIAKAADKTLLNAIVEKADEIQKGSYTDASWDELIAAIDKAKEVWADNQAAKSAVNEALDEVVIALAGLQEADVETVDKVGLQIVYDTFKGKTNQNYTDASWSSYQSALSQAEAVLANNNATVAQVEAATKGLLNASMNLAEKAPVVTPTPVTPTPTPPQVVATVDKTGLQTVYDIYIVVKRQNYTTASWNNYQNAIAEAGRVLANDNATTAQVNSVTIRLVSAHRGLTQAIVHGKVYTVKGIRYRVLSTATGKERVRVLGASKKTVKTVTIPKTVKINGVTCKVTEIGEKAFKNYKNLTKVTVGANVQKIRKEAFMGSKKLKTITIKSKVLTSVGSKAFRNISAKATIKIPKAKRSAYEKLLKNKGQSSTVKMK